MNFIIFAVGLFVTALVTYGVFSQVRGEKTPPQARSGNSDGESRTSASQDSYPAKA
ncbi:MAG: hypothetical protein HKN33_09215 [Pyrinomonadaceae bacterium]|nr:hypothetical protein [Pyrinomonadaceae bacterium]